MVECVERAGFMTKLFCFGLGYSASVFARRLAAQGWSVAGTRRSERGITSLEAQSFHGVVFDGAEPSAPVREALRDATHVLLSIPPNADGDPAFLCHANDIARAPSLRWIGYLSTVGVYGDANGAWVDELTPARPGSVRGQRRLDAETAWLDLGAKSGKPVYIFRLPGIYGPGRSAIDDLRDGSARRLIKAGQVFNRIHVADIANALEASLTRPLTNRVYNITDDEPAPPQDVVAYGAQLLGLPVPPDRDFATAELSEMARSFYSENKRVSNARMKGELGVKLSYPNYRLGLQEIVQNLR
jgi:nucleoside-diphosphate-sugar epimerase